MVEIKSGSTLDNKMRAAYKFSLLGLDGNKPGPTENPPNLKMFERCVRNK